ncbi:MAG: universal stress protein [Deltaproteobacteria bacterium]|nr:universal stress protein [Deltaproteobacteria bacterium]
MVRPSCNKGVFANKLYAVFCQREHADDYLDMFPPGSRPVTDKDDERWQRIVEQVFLVVRKLARENDIEVETRVMNGDPAASILKLARELDVDVVVIGSTGKGMVARALLGSVSREVVDHAPCSVFLVRA